MSLVLASPLIIQCLVFLVVAGSLLLVGQLLGGGDQRVLDRFESLRNPSSDRPVLAKRGLLRLLIPALPEPFMRAIMPNDEATRTRLQGKLAQAGIYSSRGLAGYFTIKLLLTVGPTLACFLAGGVGVVRGSYALLIGTVVGLVGMMLPDLWLARLRSQRHTILRRSLSDFLDLVVTCLEGGLGMQAALKQVSDELQLAHPVLAGELQIVLGEMELGRPLELALAHLAERTGVEELRSLSTFVQQASKFGTAMSDAMRQLADMLRQQREHRAEELAQKAAVKILFPTLIFIFPTVFVVLAGPAAIQIKEGLAINNGQKMASPQSK